jgi:hypothetical protein
MTAWMRRCGLAGIWVASAWLFFFGILILGGSVLHVPALDRLTVRIAEWLTRPTTPYRLEAGALAMWNLVVWAGLLLCASLLLWSGGKSLERRKRAHGNAV